MAELVLGPMLRHVGEHGATVWVETDSPCAVRVLDTVARTFTVAGHHYALVIVEGLTPGSVIPYEVHLDDERRWPLPDSELPPSVIRTLTPEQPLRILFGSCRAAAPHEPPWDEEREFDDRGRGVDAMRAHGLAMLQQPPAQWPDLLLLLGDQVYADDSSPVTRKRIAARRGENADRSWNPAPDEVADFEEYTWLYEEAWSPEVERWMFSVVPSAMIFDDHDMIDDWNISQSWVDDIRAEPWWEDHVIGGVMAYWIYQHLGNLAPAEIRDEGMLDAFVAAGDATDLLRDWALQTEQFTPVPGGYQFSYSRTLGRVRLIVIDCRNGRVLEPGGRKMVDDAEWSWVEEHSMVDCDHLLLATSLPVLMPGGLHDLEGWNEAVCDGAWGRWFVRVGEKVRRGLDLEDWPAFRTSFARYVALLRNVSTPDRPDGCTPPATVCMLSGDVHFTYRTTAEFDPVAGRPAPTSAVHQLVCSPMRNALTKRERLALRVALSKFGRVLGKGLRRSVRQRRPDMRWQLDPSVMFNNDMAVLDIDGRDARVHLQNAETDEERHVVLSGRADHMRRPDPATRV